MSRVGNEPIKIPEGVEVEIEGRKIKVKSSKGELERILPAEISAEKKNSEILVSRASSTNKAKSLHGLARTLIANMIEGVSSGFAKELELVGVGYRVSKKGDSLELQVGYSKPVNVAKEEGIEFEVPAPNKIVVKGINKEVVGRVAAKVRSVRSPEPYKGKGIRYVGEYVRRKAGKTAK